MNTLFLKNGLNNINERLDKIENNIEEILKILRYIEPDCHKMGDHINFVEKVYENTRKPLNFIINQVNKIRSIGNSENQTECDLPRIEDENKNKT